LAGFQVILIGRVCVIAEANKRESVELVAEAIQIEGQKRRSCRTAERW